MIWITKKKRKSEKIEYNDLYKSIKPFTLFYFLYSLKLSNYFNTETG